MSSHAAEIHASAVVGRGSRVWEGAKLREQVRLGEECVVGRGAYLGAGVVVGDRVKIQNDALVYEPAVLERGVFIGPAAVITNDRAPRAVTPDGALKTSADWTPVGVTVCEGASIGARAVCVAPVVVGRWAMVGAGAVVTSDVPDFALVVGVPARRVGWVGRAGHRLVSDDGQRWCCPATGEAYELAGATLVEVGKR